MSEFDRRALLKLAALYPVSLSLAACGKPQEVATPFNISRQEAKLSDIVPADTIPQLQIEKILDLSAAMYELPVSDERKTFVHVFDNLVDINFSDIKTVYDFYSEGNLSQIIESLKRGKRINQDYLQLRAANTNITVFRHEVAPSQAIALSIFPRTAQSQRHLIIVGGSETIPDWAQPVSGVTRIRNNVSFSVINMKRIREQQQARNTVWKNEFEEATFALLVEMGQQMLSMRGHDGSQLLDSSHPLSVIGQESVCNGFALSLVNKRLGKSWPDTERDLITFAGRAPVKKPGIPETIRMFKTTESFYNSIPSTGLTIRKK